MVQALKGRAIEGKRVERERRRKKWRGEGRRIGPVTVSFNDGESVIPPYLTPSFSTQVKHIIHAFKFVVHTKLTIKHA